MSTPTITLRPPSTSATPRPSAYSTPPLTFLAGTWHVTHSTLPMWRSKRNVKITYTLLPPSSQTIPAEQTDRLDDVVSYQALDSPKVSTVHGVDKMSGGSHDAWDWRGKGWLVIAGSHWEVLGWGHEDGGNAWCVTYFAKTLFTPAGIDFYSRGREGLREETVEAIKEGLAGIEEVKELAGSVFEVKVDDGN